MKKRRNKKNFFHICLVAMSLYLFVMFMLSAVIHDNPSLIIPSVSGEIINPFAPEGNVSNYTEKFKQFEGFVAVMSGVNVGAHDLHLYALPGQRAQLYRNFSVFIFSNMPCFYEVRIDDQVYQRGYCEWRASVKASSPYAMVNIKVTLINETNTSLPVFLFKDVKLLDSPWEAFEEGEIPIAEEWIRFTRGEFNAWVLTRIAVNILFAFLAVVSGTSYATIQADLRGIQRVI